MSYGWATIFTLAAWVVGGLLEGAGILGEDTRILFAIIVMGCCVMKFIKDRDEHNGNGKQGGA